MIFDATGILLIIIAALCGVAVRALLGKRKNVLMQYAAFAILGIGVGCIANLFHSALKTTRKFEETHLRFSAARNYVDGLNLHKTLEAPLLDRIDSIQTEIERIPKGEFRLYNNQVQSAWKGIINSANQDIAVVNSLSKKDWNQLCEEDDDQGCVKLQKSVSDRIQICRFHIYKNPNHKKDLQSLAKLQSEAKVIPVFVSESKINRSEKLQDTIKLLGGYRTIMLVGESILMRFSLTSLKSRLKESKLQFVTDKTKSDARNARAYFCLLYNKRDKLPKAKCKAMETCK